MKTLYHGTTTVRYLYGIRKEGLRGDMPVSFVKEKHHLGYSYWTTDASAARRYAMMALGVDTMRFLLFGQLDANDIKFNYLADGTPIAQPHSFLWDLYKKGIKTSIGEAYSIVILELQSGTWYDRMERDPEQEPITQMREKLFTDAEFIQFNKRFPNGDWYRYKGKIPPQGLRVIRSINGNEFTDEDIYTFKTMSKESIEAA